MGNLETGMGNLETGMGNLETVNWKLETGIWKLETGDWKLKIENRNNIHEYSIYNYLDINTIIMSENILKVKSFQFAVEIVELYKQLSTEKREFVLSKQILKSGTSIGANVEEAIGGQSEADFMSKLSIAYKEARETSYWIRLLRETNILEVNKAKKLLDDCDELQRIIGSSIKTIKAKRVK